MTTETDRRDKYLYASAVLPAAIGTGAAFTIIGVAGEAETIVAVLTSILVGQMVFFLSWMACFMALKSWGDSDD